MRAHLRVGPELRQRTLAHVAIAAVEILPAVLVVPVFGDGERRRPLVPADLLSISPQTAWLDCAIRFLPTRPELLASPSGNRVGGGVQQQPRRLDRVAGDHHVARFLEAPASFAEIVHARGGPAASVSTGRPSPGRGFPRPPRSPAGIQVTSALCLALVEQPVDAEAAIDAGMRQPARRRQRRQRRLGPLDAHRLAAPRQRLRGGVQFMRAIRIARTRAGPRDR